MVVVGTYALATYQYDMTSDCGCKYEYHTLDNLRRNLGYGPLEDMGSSGFPIAIAFINLKFMAFARRMEFMRP